MLGKSITYVTAQCHYFSVNYVFLQVMAPFSPVEVFHHAWKNPIVAKKWVWQGIVTIADCRPTNGIVWKRHRTCKVSTTFCYNLKFLTHFLKIANIIST